MKKIILLSLLGILCFIARANAQWEHDGTANTAPFSIGDLKYEHSPNRLVVKFKDPYWKPSGKKSNEITVTGISTLDALGSKYGIADITIVEGFQYSLNGSVG